MRMIPGPTDAPEFVDAVNLTVGGLLRQSRPESLVVVQIDNWFGQKWLGFSGLPIPHVAVFYRDEETRIPPFVPNRVVSQHRFAGPSFEEIEPGDPIHQKIRSSRALRRKASEACPGALLVWYSTNSQKTKRGSLMAYIPEGVSYRYWYAQWQDVHGWHVVQTDGIKLPELAKLTQPDQAIPV